MPGLGIGEAVGIGLGGLGLAQGGKAKKGGGGASFEEAERFAGLQADIAEDLFQQTSPLRTSIINQLGAFIGVPPPAITPPTVATALPSIAGAFRDISEDDGRIIGFLEEDIGGDLEQNILRRPIFGTEEFLASQQAQPEQSAVPAPTGGTIPPSLLPAFAPLREATEAQFETARENILARTGARGGQLTQALTDIELGRSQAIGALEAPLRESLFNQALGIAFGQPAQSTAGLSAAGQSLTQLASIASAQQAAQGQAGGSLLSLGLKAALKGNKGSSGGAANTTIPFAVPGGGTAVATLGF